ncbi:MAG: antibiotic biosynthesis monooxygenase [Flavobacterium sp.]|nr:antibiotic biosynthesis monooxygenase [Pedobacter sp.]
MITRIVKLNLHPQYSKKFEQIFYQSRASIENFDGCQTTTLFKVSGTESQYFTISYWQSEKHLENYRASLLFKNIWQQVKPLFSSKAEAYTLNSV